MYKHNFVIVFLLLGFFQANATEITGIVKGESNKNCSGCIIILSQSDTVHKKISLQTQLSNSSKGIYSFFIDKPGRYTIEILDKNKQSNPFDFNIEVGGPDLIALDHSKIQFSALSDYQTFSLATNDMFKEAHVRETLDQLRNEFHFIINNKGNIKVAVSKGTLETNVFLVSKNPEHSRSLSIQINISNNDTIKKIGIGTYNKCYNSLVNVKHVRVPTSLKDFTELTQGDQVVFLKSNGHLLLLKDEKVFDYGDLRSVMTVDFNQPDVNEVAPAKHPVIMYPPDKTSKTKIYYLSENSSFLDLSITPKGKYGVKWREIKKTSSNNNVEFLFRNKFVESRAIDLSILSSNATKTLNDFSKYGSRDLSEATNSLNEVVKHCSLLGNDKHLQTNFYRHLWNSRLTEIKNTLKQYSIDNFKLKNSSNKQAAN